MSYKYGHDYDDIIDIKAEMDFIRTFFSTENDNNFNVLEDQMFKLYELECNEHKYSIIKDRGKIWYEEEFHLSHHIKSRNDMLICRVSLEYLGERYPKVKEGLGDEYDRLLKKYDGAIIAKTLEILQICIWIFNAKGSNIIYGKERNVELYKSLLSELLLSQTKEQGKQKNI